MTRDIFEEMKEGFEYLNDNKTPIIENGEWTVFKNGKEVYLTSDDFEHDAWLKVSGDFETTTQKINYAQEICNRLNKFNTK